MHRVLSQKLWKQVRQVARSSRQRQAAIAYATSDLVGFQSGDLLIVDASAAVIKAGGTSAKLLSELALRGVVLHNCPGLHAKVLLMDTIAVVGSGNMSASSRSALVEAAIMTDAAPVVSGVASLIEQLRQQSEKLDEDALRALAKIKVVQRRGTPARVPQSKPKITELGTRTWLVGVVGYDGELTDPEQHLTDEARAKLAKEYRTQEDSISWIRWTGNGTFSAKCQPGDQLIQILRESPTHKRPAVVLRPTSLLLKKRAKGSTFVFVKDAEGRKSEITWTAFKKLMKQLGYRRRFGPGSEAMLDPALAERISHSWSRA